MHFNKIVLIILFLGSALAIKSEYILYKKGASGDIETINDDVLHKKIYNTLLKYQWPTCIAHFHEFNSQEVEKYTASGSSYEENYLRIKIQEIDKNLDIAFIPTTLYELFFITYKKSYLKSHSTKFDLSLLISNPDNNITSIFDYFSQFNHDEYYQNIHSIVNDDLIVFIKNFEFNQHSKQGNFSNFIEKNIDKLLNLLSYGDLGESLHQEEILKKTLILEYKAHKNNSGLLYRGTKSPSFSNIGSMLNPIEITYLDNNFHDNFFFNGMVFNSQEMQQLKDLINKEKTNQLSLQDKGKLEKLKAKFIELFNWRTPARSISYGNSILAGYFRDKGACAFYYIARSYTTGYALFINKWLYYKGTCSNDTEKKTFGKLIDGELFVISPLNTIAALLSEGELFHSRSRSYYYLKNFKNTTAKSHIFGKRIPGLGCRNLDAINYLVKHGSPLRRGAELAEFIAQRAELIKLPTLFSSEVTETYFTSQKNMAELFDYMVRHEPYLKQTLELQ